MIPEATAHPISTTLQYMPPPPISADFEKEFKRTVIINDMTGEPILRFVWGMDITEQCGEYTIHRYPDPLGKYVGLDRWVLEGWQDPRVYDEAEWRMNEDIMGPFPSKGIWDYIATVQDPVTGGYLPLGGFAMKLVREWRHWRSKDKPRVIADLLKERAALQVVKEKQAKARRDEVMDNFVRDASRAERGGWDPRRRRTISKIDADGNYINLEEELEEKSRIITLPDLSLLKGEVA